MPMHAYTWFLVELYNCVAGPQQTGEAATSNDTARGTKIYCCISNGL